MAQKRIQVTRKLIVVGALTVGLMALSGTASASNIGAPAPTVDRCAGVDPRIVKTEKSLCRGYSYQSPVFAAGPTTPSTSPDESSTVQSWILVAGLGFAGVSGAFAATRKGPFRHMLQ